MPLTPGARIGVYEIVGPLGAGGMGEVYRARDGRLDRDVAIKILSEIFALDPERTARFEREAKTLAALNHPHIAQIFGLEAVSAGSGQALVMELVEGEDLSQRLERGPIPVDEAMEIARQIADALEAAHEQGIIHRDLKPGNIKIRPDGTVKVLDFGLAKALTPDSGVHQQMNSPTFTSAHTQMGVILGTAAYMSPEQAKGKAVDRRADIWAFGVVLHEMLTGQKLWIGETAAETLAHVITRDVDLSLLPSATPTRLRSLLARCLVKDPKARLRDIGEARVALAEMIAGIDSGVKVAPQPVPSARTSPLPWLTAGTMAVAAIGFAALWLQTRAPGNRQLRMSISLPDGHRVMSGPIISRDGGTIAFASGDGREQPRLYVRKLDSFELRELQGTAGATRPFFSPEGRWLGFFANGTLFKLDLEGGAPTSLSDAPSPGGGTWSEDGTIVFTPTWNGGLYRLKAGGGRAELIIKPDLEKKEYGYTSPLFLPGGKELLFSSWGATFAIERVTLGDLQRAVIAPTFWTSPVYVPSGHVLAPNDRGDVQAFAYPPSSGDPPPVTVVEKVDWGGGSGDGESKFAVSDTGTLVYAPGDVTQRSLVVVDETGRAVPVAGKSHAYMALALAPDGSRVAAEEGAGIWLVDLARGGRTPLAPEQRSGAQVSATWSLDSSQVYFGSNLDGNWEVYATSATQSGGMKRVLQKEFDQVPAAIAPDGTLLIQETRPGSGRDLWLLPPDGTAVVWLATAADEAGASFSPDGQMIAYVSNASGRAEVYAQARDRSSARVQVSTGGGDGPVWAPSGRRLYYREGNALMRVDLGSGAGVPVGIPQRLFDRGWELPAGAGFGVLPGGNRFVMIRFAPAAIPTRLDVVFNWLDELRKRVPVK